MTADFSTSDGTARVDEDYLNAMGQLSFGPGEAEKSFTVTIVRNTQLEGDQTINLSLANLTGGAVLDNPRQAIVTIERQQGDPLVPDLQFGLAGNVFTDFGDTEETIYDVVELSDGRLLAVGGLTFAGNSSDFLLARYDANGDLDTSFGSAGRLRTDFALAGDVAHAVELLSDDQFLVAGNAFAPTEPGTGGVRSSVAVARYNEDGTLDRNFGADGDGRILISIPEQSLSARALHLLDDGRFLVGGLADRQAAVFRFLANGELDATFGDGGIAKIAGLSEAVDMVVQDDGKIVIAADQGDNINDEFIGVARLMPDGSLDASYGVGGIVDFNPLNFREETPIALELQPDGRLLLVGHEDEIISADILVARFNGDGSLDPSFCEVGFVLQSVSVDEDRAIDLLVQDDDRIIVLAKSEFLQQETLSLLSFNPDGTLDTAFAGSGIVALPQRGFEGFDTFGELILQRDKKLLLASQGRNNESVNFNFLMKRFLGNPARREIRFRFEGYEIDENGTTALIGLERRFGAAGEVSVQFATSAGSAQPGEDYEETITTVTFADGDIGRSVQVPISDNPTFESPETVQLNISNPLGGVTLGDRTAATLTIFDGPGEIQFASSVFNITENRRFVNIRFQRVRGSDGSVTAQFDAIDRTALGNDDYRPISTTVTFDDRETIATVRVQVFDDDQLEGRE